MPLYIMSFASQEDRNNTLNFNGLSLGRHTISIEIPDSQKNKKAPEASNEKAIIPIQEREVNLAF